MDTVHRFLFDDLDIRGALVQIGPAWREMQAGRGYPPAMRDLLGDLTAVTTLIGCNLKAPGHLTIHLRGHGPVSILVVDCDNLLRLRGMAKANAAVAMPTVAAGPADVRALLGDGQLALSLRMESSEQPYQSVVPLEGASTAAIFEHYLTQSEQSPARLWLHANGAHACGLLLQKMPGAEMRDADGWNRVQQLAATVRPAELELPPATLLTRLFPDETVRLFDPQRVSHHCPRDEDKVREMLRALGRDELLAALEQDGTIAIHDDICDHHYSFGREIIEELFPSAPAAPPPILH